MCPTKADAWCRWFQLSSLPLTAWVVVVGPFQAAEYRGLETLGGGRARRLGSVGWRGERCEVPGSWCRSEVWYLRWPGEFRSNQSAEGRTPSIRTGEPSPHLEPVLKSLNTFAPPCNEDCATRGGLGDLRRDVCGCVSPGAEAGRIARGIRSQQSLLVQLPDQIHFTHPPPRGLPVSARTPATPPFPHPCLYLTYHFTLGITVAS